MIKISKIFRDEFGDEIIVSSELSKYCYTEALDFFGACQDVSLAISAQQKKTDTAVGKMSEVVIEA